MQKVFNNLLEKFLSNKSDSVLYLALQPSDMNTVKSYVPKDTIFFDLDDSNLKISPLSPFLYELKDWKPDVKVINESTYDLQQNSFVSYLSSEVATERFEPVIYEEIFYEKKRCFHSVLELLGKHPVSVRVILNGQLLCDESIEIIKELASTNPTQKTIVCFDVTQMSIASMRNSFFSDVVSYRNYFEVLGLNAIMSSTGKTLDNEQNILMSSKVIGRDFNKKPNLDSNSRIYEIDLSENLANLSINEIFIALRNCRLFFSFSTAKSFIQFVNNHSEIIDANREEWEKLYLEISIVQLNSGEIDDALFFLHTATEETVSLETVLRSDLFSSKIFFIKSSYDVAMRFVQSLLQKAPVGTPFYALGLMMSYTIAERRNNHCTEKVYLEMLSELKKCGYKNHCVYYSLVFPYEYLQNMRKQTNFLEKVDSIIKEAKNIDNQFSLSVAYHWKGIVLSNHERKEEGFSWFIKCLEIRMKIGDPSAIIKSKNGVSYECFLRAKYTEAYDLINNFMDYIPLLDDYTEIVLSFYNVAKILFFGNDFEQAYSVLQKVSKLMQIFEMEDFIYCAKDDVVILKAIIDFYRGSFVQSQIAFYNIERKETSHSGYIEPLIWFLRALFLLEEKDPKTASEYCDKGLSLCEGMDHEMCFVSFNFASKLYEYGEESLAKEFYEKGIEYAKIHNFTYYLDTYQNKKLSNLSGLHADFEPLKSNLSYVEELAEKEILINKVHKKVQDSQFLNKITALGSRCNSEVSYVKNFCNLFCDYIFVRGLFVAERNLKGTWECVESVSKTTDIKPSSKEWNHYFMRSGEKTNNQLQCIDSTHYYMNLSRFGFVASVLIVLEDNSFWTLEERNTVYVALSYLHAQITMFKQNAYLEEISITDQLTRLNNRRALQQKITESSELILRHRESGAEQELITITFMDLDNFKYINDTLGHRAGDVIIASFANLLKKIYRKVDFISRFGGDEFVVLLYNTSIMQANRATERLRQGLEKRNYFISDLENALGVPVSIPKESLLGFSAGISNNMQVESPEMLEQVLLNADKALYNAKESGKNRTEVWKSEHNES